MSEQIVIGKMLDSKRVQTTKGKHDLGDWDHRAMWSCLRLQFGKQTADKDIHDYFDQIQAQRKKKLTKNERMELMKEYFEQQTQQIQKPRRIQFILDQGDNVMAVASLKHLLIPPQEVYDLAGEIIKTEYPKLKDIAVAGLQGEQLLIKSVAGIKLGLQVFGGDITTRQAIAVSSWMRVEQCLNVLSWLGIGGLGSILGGGRARDYERVLRIKVKAELEPRLREGIKAALVKEKALEQRLQLTKTVPVKRTDADIIMAALGFSYMVGGRTVQQILDRLDKEPKTQYGMSMASSWVAAHGKLMATPEMKDRKIEQKLSTISAAAILLDDIKEAKERSIEWLQGHIQKGQVKTIDDIIKELQLKEKRKK